MDSAVWLNVPEPLRIELIQSDCGILHNDAVSFSAEVFHGAFGYTKTVSGMFSQDPGTVCQIPRHIEPIFHCALWTIHCAVGDPHRNPGLLRGKNTRGIQDNVPGMYCIITRMIPEKAVHFPFQIPIICKNGQQPSQLRLFSANGDPVNSSVRFEFFFVEPHRIRQQQHIKNHILPVQQPCGVHDLRLDATFFEVSNNVQNSQWFVLHGIPLSILR